jgi:GlpG protein
MRSLTTIEGQARAEAFVAYLLTQDISTHVEPADADQKSWEIWIRDEDKIALASQELALYRANPDDPKYPKAIKDAKSILREQQEVARARQRKIHTHRDLSKNSLLGGTIPALTLTLLILCCALSVISNFSAPGQSNRLGLSIVKQLKFVDMQKYKETGDPAYSIKRGQWWRVLTPMFLHGTPIHLLMNMLALVSLGRLTERLEGVWRYAVLLVLFAMGSHILQGLLPANVLGIHGLSGTPNFVGISGVVMGLFGYIAAKSYFRNDLEIGLSPSAYIMVAILLIAGFAGDISGKPGNMPMANFAHLGGLITGLILGWVMSFPYWNRSNRLPKG